MCEEHSIIAILRREKVPKYLNRKKEKGQYVCDSMWSVTLHTEGKECCCPQRAFGGNWEWKGEKKKKRKKKTLWNIYKYLAFAKIWSSGPLGSLLAQGLLLFKIINSQLSFCQNDWLSQCRAINLTELEDRGNTKTSSSCWYLLGSQAYRGLEKSYKFILGGKIC